MLTIPINEFLKNKRVVLVGNSVEMMNYEYGDFIEGIKATIIDRDHTPNWRFASLEDVDQSYVDKMLAPYDEASF